MQMLNTVQQNAVDEAIIKTVHIKEQFKKLLFKQFSLFLFLPFLKIV